MDYSGGSNAKLDPAKRDEFMNEVKQQLAIASAQELLQVFLFNCAVTYMYYSVVIHLNVALSVHVLNRR